MWALAIFVVFLILYGVSRDHLYQLDVLAYAGRIEKPITSLAGAVMFEPSHALWYPTGRLFYWALHGLKVPLRGYETLQLLNAFVGAAGLSMIFLILARVTSRPWALFWTLPIAFFWNYWQKSAGGEGHLLGAFWVICFCGALLSYWQDPSWKGVALVGVYATLATGYHFGNIAVWGAAYLMVALRLQGRQAWFHLGLLTIVFSAAALPYAWIQGWFETGGIYQWWIMSTGLMDTGFHPKALGLFKNLPLSMVAMAQGVVYFDHLSLWTVITVIVLIGFMTGGVVCGGWVHPDPPAERQVNARHLSWLLLAPFACLFVFYTLWAPGERTYWIVQPVILGMVVACWTFYRQPPKILNVQRVCFSLAAVLLGVHNYFAFILPNKTNQLQYVLNASREIGRLTPPDSRIVVSGLNDWGNLKCYLPYFAERRPLAFDLLVMDARMRQVPPVLWAREVVSRFLNSGVPVYITEDLLKARSLKAGGAVFPQEEIKSIWKGCSLLPVAAFQGKSANALYLLRPDKSPIPSRPR